MYGTSYIFSKEFFTGWIVVGILWLFFSAFAVGLYPLWEGRHSMAHTFKAIYLDITGKKKPKLQGREGVAEEIEEDSQGLGTPTEKVTPKEG